MFSKGNVSKSYFSLFAYVCYIGIEFNYYRQMNRSWMSKDRRSKEYEDGVENFISFAIKNSGNQNSIKCPYLQCGNLIFNTP